MSFIEFFFDPLYRAPVLGSMLMCLSAAVMGTLLLVKKRSLLGETLSHAAYPGVMLGALIGTFLFPPSNPLSILIVLIGAFLFSYLGIEVVEKLQSRLRIHLDASLCLVLSLFLGVGVVLASRIQFISPLWYQQSQVFLYGQAATMTDVHILIYGVLSLLIVTFIICRYREIECALFDSSFSQAIGMNLNKVIKEVFFLLILSIVVGIRSVGVILISGMLIAPATAARPFTDRLSMILVLAGMFGMISAVGGNYLSIRLSMQGLSYPTGPMILLFSVGISLLSLLFAPKKGAISRLIRIVCFRHRCTLENILKTLWKEGIKKPLTLSDISQWNPIGRLQLKWAIYSLKREGWIQKTKSGKILLTPDGVKRGAYLVRLHRLWELYLVSCLNVDEERVHCSAEEMEHIITPDLEARLSIILNYPTIDPHKKPIPAGENHGPA